MTTRVIFMGTPAFAVPSLEAVASLMGSEVVTVVTQPDRPVGRGRTLQPSPVRLRAEALGLPVWTPDNLKRPDDQQRLRDLAPDLLVVVAYGEILRRAVLAIPPRGAINVHASLLPRHRGAAPIAWSLLSGDLETGVTVMLMDEGMDTGPMLATRALPIRPDHTTGTLTDELARLGAALLAETLPRWLAGELAPQQQPDEGVTYTRLLRKEDGQLDWRGGARELAAQVRAFDPWPGSYTSWQGRPLKIVAATLPAVALALPAAPPGTVATSGGLVAVATGEGWLALEWLQLAGKKAMSARDFVNGYPSFVGSLLGEVADQTASAQP